MSWNDLERHPRSWLAVIEMSATQNVMESLSRLEGTLGIVQGQLLILQIGKLRLKKGKVLV